MSNVITWETGEAWSDVYTEIVNIGTDKPIVCLVAYDEEADRLITANGGLPTLLSNVLFIGLSPINASDTDTKLRVGVEAGFVLGTDSARGSAAVLQSKNIVWVAHCAEDPWTDGSPLILALDGGGLSIEACDGEAVFAGVPSFQITLTNRAQLAMPGGAPCIATVSETGFGSLWLTDASQVSYGCFPNGSNIRVTTDASSQWAGAATVAGDPPIEQYLDDRAEQAGYDDNRETALTLGAVTVQEAIDAIKRLLAAP